MCSLANSIKKLGYEFEWIKDASDFDKAEVGLVPHHLTACTKAEKLKEGARSEE